MLLKIQQKTLGYKLKEPGNKRFFFFFLWEASGMLESSLFILYYTYIYIYIYIYIFQQGCQNQDPT